ncbi:MAG: hypothetical protein R3C12_02730 [Planctomycetaceae bacterium]|nr:hypothetical protein [Planctomycetaceae bacterium]
MTQRARRTPFPVIKFFADASIVIAALLFVGCFLGMVLFAVQGQRLWSIGIGIAAAPLALTWAFHGELLALLLSLEAHTRLSAEQAEKTNKLLDTLRMTQPASLEATGENLLITCPACTAKFTASRDFAGKMVRCGKCGTKFIAEG